MSKIFYAKTNEGYTIKILAELLQNIIKTASIKISPQGINLRMMDSSCCVLIDVELQADKFHRYEIEEEFNFGINLTFFHKMLKSIKKKDELALYMNEDEPDFLHIEIQPKDNDGKSLRHIHIQYLQSVDIPLPTGYSNPVIISSNKYQRTIKEITAIGDGTLDIIMRKYSLDIACESNQVYGAKLFFGESDDNTKEILNEKFNIEFFSRTVKIAGLNKNMYVYGHKNYPIFLKTNVGQLGTISVFIKSIKQIEDSKV